jgi:Ankyrin repeats (3 copies)/Ankyrin repeat
MKFTQLTFALLCIAPAALGMDPARPFNMLRMNSPSEGREPDIYEKINFSNTLSRAVDNNDIPFLQSFLDAGGDPNFKLMHGSTLLYSAVTFNKFESAQFLLSRGANPNNGWFSKPPLMSAVDVDCPNMVALLLHYHANPDIQEDKDGDTPLHKAVKIVLGGIRWHNNYEQIVQLLAEGNARVDIKNQKEQTAIGLAYENITWSVGKRLFLVLEQALKKRHLTYVKNWSEKMERK